VNGRGKETSIGKTKVDHRGPRPARSGVNKRVIPSALGTEKKNVERTGKAKGPREHGNSISQHPKTHPKTGGVSIPAKKEKVQKASPNLSEAATRLKEGGGLAYQRGITNIRGWGELQSSAPQFLAVQIMSNRWGRKKE